MTIQLLTSEDYIKSLLPIDKNLAGQYLAPAMFQAQEVGLKCILGSRLLEVLKEYEASGDWTGHLDYRDLRDRCQNYLAYQSIVEVLPMVAYKVSNLGAVHTTDERVESLSREQVDALMENYQAKADFFCYELQRWLLANQGAFPELCGCQLAEIRSNLHSMASGGLWLGGYYGGSER